jgi:SAM-dependent methyltransferase
VVEDQRRLDWNERHRAGDFEGRGPNPTLVAGVSGWRPGSALELASGSGTNAVWLASRGWRTTAVDWSSVGLASGKLKADEAGVAVEWLEHDLLAWSPPAQSFDLVLIVYLHLPPDERGPVYAAAAAAVAPEGRLLIVGHDRLHGAEGQGGPDPDRLFTAEEIGRELLTADPSLVVERAEVVRRVPAPGSGPIDALLVLYRIVGPDGTAPVEGEALVTAAGTDPDASADALLASVGQ